MKMFNQVLFLLVLWELRSEADIKVSVYYESLCPGSQLFIVSQVYPTYKVLEKYISLDLVPFGKASAVYNNGTWQFICQHGPSECYGNKIQACALAIGSAQNSTYFVYCAMSSGRNAASTEILQQCSQNAGITWEKLTNCYENGDADQFLAKNGDRTKSVVPPIRYVPTVTFNSFYNETVDQQAYHNLEGVVCALLENKPNICRGR